jgi:serine/threonine protein phosphatase PrpC
VVRIHPDPLKINKNFIMEGGGLSPDKNRPETGEAEKGLDRQQKKIALYFQSSKNEGEDYLFGRTPLPEDEDISLLKDVFLNELSCGEIPDEEFQEMLQLMAAPSATISRAEANEKSAKTAANFFSREVDNNKRVRGLLATFVKEDFSKRDLVEVDDLVAFAKKYPDPIALEENLSKFLDLVEKRNGSEKRKEYEQDLTLFLEKFYGKRWEYYQKINQLKDQTSESGYFAGAVENRLDSPLEIKTKNGQIVAGTDEGVGYKDVNEDGVAINAAKEAFISIDGIGGHSGGQEAKNILSESFLAGIRDGHSFEEIQRRAHLAMKKRGRGGACYVAGRIIEDREGAVLEVAQAGDARLVVLDEEGAKLATQDENNPQKKNIVSNFVSYNYQGKTTTRRFRLREGDRVVVASDGLWDNLTPQDVHSLVKGKSPRKAMAALNKRVKRAMASGGKPDNLNIIIYDFRPEEKNDQETPGLIAKLRKKINLT